LTTYGTTIIYKEKVGICMKTKAIERDKVKNNVSMRKKVVIKVVT